MEETQARAGAHLAATEVTQARAEDSLAAMEVTQARAEDSLAAMEVTLEVTLAQEVSWHVAISLNWLMLTPLTQEVSRIK